MAIPNSYQILQAVIEATPDAIFVKDLEGRYVLVNDAAARFLGKSPDDIIGKRDLELYPEDTARRFIEDDRRVLATGQPQAFEGVATGPGVTQAYLVTKGVYRDAHGRTLGLFGISHDITELRQANQTLDQTREALFRSQKMEAVGQLTGGIAHDFNNILAVILGNAELLRAYLTLDPQIDELIEAIIRASLHGRDLTSQLLAFSGRRLLNPQAIDVNALVTSTVKLLTRTLGAAVRVELSLSPGADTAFVDPAALEAALLNVALNARDAMPEGGVLSIGTSRVVVSDAPVTDDEPKPGAYAALTIADTGSGMPPDVLARVFEPFFTTKAGGRGTGLGLSMVYGFARQSGGTVTIVSAPGGGTTLSILLPVASGAPNWDAPAAVPAKGKAVSRLALVVEDEADVRSIVRRHLEGLGHRVLSVEAGREALLILQGPEAPDLLLTDVVLPGGMSGIDVAQAARELRPGLPVIFMSGFAAMPGALNRIRDIGGPLLTKPFTTQQLSTAIQSVFGHAPRARATPRRPAARKKRQSPPPPRPTRRPRR